jgi:hypothetical protein
LLNPVVVSACSLEALNYFSYAAVRLTFFSINCLRDLCIIIWPFILDFIIC